ncbi:MAG: formimidoylglutamase [Rhodothermales bacterium]|nr:formimidoylglutamase [Rhodothermales bacterium]
MIRPSVPLPDTHADDPRLGRWLASNRLDEATRVALVGFPSDEGVRRNGGRVGAAAGPSALRTALYRLTPDARNAEAFAALLERTVDLGDVPVTGDLERDQDALGAVVADALARGIVPIVLGGGHETTYGHALGYVQTRRPFHLLNWDAHADVRPLVDGLGHSGSPFRQVLEHPSGLAQAYTLAGAMPGRVAPSHAAYASERGAVVWLDDLDEARIQRLAAEIRPRTLVSFDLDLVDAGAMPAVSAPGAGGLGARAWLRAAEACACNPNATSFDVVELNPSFDRDGIGASLAALTVWHLLAGLAWRPVV